LEGSLDRTDTNFAFDLLQGFVVFETE